MFDLCTKTINGLTSMSIIACKHEAYQPFQR